MKITTNDIKIRLHKDDNNMFEIFEDSPFFVLWSVSNVEILEKDVIERLENGEIIGISINTEN